MKTVMQHQFSKIENASIPRATFNRSHGHKSTFDAGQLVPILVDEALPGDTFNLKLSAFARMATPIHPIMDNMYMETFFFAIPYRLVWDNFQKFMGEQENPGDSTDYTIPARSTPVTLSEGKVSDYMGLPTKTTAPISGFSILPHRAMLLCFNEWFRDENLQDSYPIDKDDTQAIASTFYGPDSDPLIRGKRHDYFTSCLPWPQKSDSGSVPLPLGSSAPVTGIGAFSPNATTSLAAVSETDATATANLTGWHETDSLLPGAGKANVFIEEDPNNTGYPNIRADLTNATAATINQLRLAVTVQQMFEADARGGTRYTEIIRSHFGVVSADQRLQRPEFLGGGSTPVNISPIAQTSSTDATTPQGNLAAMGTVNLSGHGFTKSFTEHSIILGFVNVRADLTYQQGLDRMWSRSTRHDFYFPTFANLGEQAVLNKEIYTDGSANDDLVFGYQEHWSDMRQKRSLITGAFRSNAATPLDSWHLSEDFTTLPALNSTFITDPTATTLDRAIATPAEPQFIFDSYMNYTCARPLPRYSTPGLVRF